MIGSRWLAASIAALAAFVAGALPAGASLDVHPESFNLQIDQGEILTVPLHITNLGPASPLGFTVTDDRPWLSESPTSGQIPLGDTVEVTVTVDATALAPGNYSGTITVVDPHHGPIAVPVLLQVQGAAGVGGGGARAADLALLPAVPNPVRHAAAIAFRAPAGALARLRVLDIRGRDIAVLFEGTTHGEVTRVAWDARDHAGAEIPSGVYFVVLESGTDRVVRRMLRVR